jgi:hypothetical protein
MRHICSVLAMVILGWGLAISQNKPKRLILKDGSYELVGQYELKGDRVRYFSAERHEWEELPASSVDWRATEAYAENAETAGKTRVTESEDNATRERAEEAARRPEVAPGLRLPENGGVFLLDSYQAKQALYRIQQNEASVDKNRAGNILRGAINPVASARQTIELSGLHAPVQSHVAEPVIYAGLGLEGDSKPRYSPEEIKDHLRLVRCESRKGNRVIGAIKIAVYGKAEQNAAYLDTKIDVMPGGWVKLRPGSPLPAGEYALVELLEKDALNLFVWDFGIDPAAPKNQDPYIPERGSPDKPPVLLIPTKPGAAPGDRR